MDNANKTAATLLALSFSASIGDEIEIHCADAKPRRVVVTATDARRIYVTSGPTLRAHLRGGLLDVSGLYGHVAYQPTITQRVRPVLDVRLVRRAERRN